VDEAEVRRLFGQRVRQRREARGWSQARLGAEMRLHRTYVNAIEQGTRNITISTITRVAAALDVSIAALFEFEGDE
jgi:transcriptional regulator with XRE-family HTH domain